MKTRRLLVVASAALVVCALLAVNRSQVAFAAAGAKSAADSFLKDTQKGDPKLKSIGTITFGPQGLLLVSEPTAASIVAIDTGDTGPVQKLKQKVDDVAGHVAARLGAPEGGADILDIAVNPLSGKIYLAVSRKADKQVAILTVDADGKLADLALDKAAWVRVPLPAAEGVKVSSITDVAFAKDRVLAAGQSNEEFSSKIFSFPLPLVNAKSGDVFSAQTYHVAHRKWETKAPIQSFIPYEEKGKHYVVGAFTCTPIVKFPLDDIKSGGDIRGTSVVELGNGNRPLDMFTYERGGKTWVVANTQRFQANLFGPSKFWGVRVTMDYLTHNEPENTNEKAAWRDVKSKSGPEGIEIVDALFGARHIDKLNNDQMVVLRENGDKLSLELAPLP